jgi:phage shock protein C
MKKTLSIHLGRQLFVIEEDAFDRLQQYLNRLEASLQGENGTAEIIEDIEMRFAELLMSYLGETRKVVTITDIEKGIESLGEPEVISEDTPREEAQSRTSSQQTGGQRRFFRDPEGGMLGGVCSGIAAYLNIDPVIVRIIFVLMAFAGFAGGLIYVILWVIVPNANTPSERLQMQGKAVTIDSLKDEVGRAADRIKDDTRRARDRFRSGNEHILERGRGIVKLFLRLLGLLLIGFATLWLIFFTLTVTGLIDFIPITGDKEYASMYDFLHITAPVGNTFDLLWASILLTGFAAPLLAIALGIRLIMDKGHRALKISFIALPLIIITGIICGAISGMQIGRDFAVYEGFEQQHLTSNTNSLVVSELPHYYAGRRIVSSGGVDFINVKNGVVTEQGIIISYRPSKDSLFHVHHYISANGIDSEAALKRGGNIHHEIQLLGDTLVVDPYYSYPVADGFRAQRIKVIIDVPKGKKLTIKNWEVTEPESEYNGSFRAGEPFEVWTNHFFH